MVLSTELHDRNIQKFSEIHEYAVFLESMDGAHLGDRL